MRIEPNNNMESIYESLNRKKVSTREENADTGENTAVTQDKVEISNTSAVSDGFSTVKSKAVESVEKGTNADRLRQIKVDIETGRYYVSSRDIASSILGKTARDE